VTTIVDALLPNVLNSLRFVHQDSADLVTVRVTASDLSPATLEALNEKRPLLDLY